MPTSSKPAPAPPKSAAASPSGPNFAKGVALKSLNQGVTFGHVDGEPALLSRKGDTLTLLAGKCTHFGAPLETGLVHGETVRCPWHHACFSLRDGAVLKAPGLPPLARWQVRIDAGTVRAGAKHKPLVLPAPAGAGPKSVAIVGGGAAAFSAAIELQQHGYAHDITIFGDEPDPPYDRIKLSKGVLAGAVDAGSIDMPQAALVAPKRVHIKTKTEVTALDAKSRTLTLANGTQHRFDAILLATGGAPRVPDNAVVDSQRVFTLRTKADAVSIQKAIRPHSHVVIVGANFIGMEAASSLKDSGAQLHVVSPADLPFMPILGRDVAQVLRSAHDQHGVVLHRGRSLKSIGARDVTLDDGSKVPADVVLLAMGVTPRTELATAAGLKVDNGIVVDAMMQTSAKGIWAAGDVAHVVDGKESWRIEHWAVAEQMGRVAARNMLGLAQPYRAIPFFWTEQYDYKFRYVGHANNITRAETFGDIEDKRAVVALYEGDTIAAVLTVGCDDISLKVEAAMEEGRHADVAQLIRI